MTISSNFRVLAIHLASVDNQFRTNVEVLIQNKIPENIAQPVQEGIIDYLSTSMEYSI